MFIAFNKKTLRAPAPTVFSRRPKKNETVFFLNSTPLFLPLGRFSTFSETLLLSTLPVDHVAKPHLPKRETKARDWTLILTSPSLPINSYNTGSSSAIVSALRWKLLFSFSREFPFFFFLLIFVKFFATRKTKLSEFLFIPLTFPVLSLWQLTTSRDLLAYYPTVESWTIVLIFREMFFYWIFLPYSSVCLRFFIISGSISPRFGAGASNRFHLLSFDFFFHLLHFFFLGEFLFSFIFLIS